jgi:hypothetical protein
MILKLISDFVLQAISRIFLFNITNIQGYCKFDHVLPSFAIGGLLKCSTNLGKHTYAFISVSAAFDQIAFFFRISSGNLFQSMLQTHSKLELPISNIITACRCGNKILPINKANCPIFRVSLVSFINSKYI